MSYAIGIDLGGSFLKGAVLDLDQMRPLHIIRRDFPPFIDGLPPGHREVRPEEICIAVRELLSDLSKEEPDAECVVMCSQMHTVLLLNSAGQPQTNAISWMDQRSLEAAEGTESSYIDLLRQSLSPSYVLALGNELRPGLAISALHWLQCHGRISDGLIPAAWPDFVCMSLTQTNCKTSPTIAAAHGSFDLASGAWHAATIDKLGLSKLSWPTVVPDGTVFGNIEFAGRHIPIFTAVGDQQAALLGSGLRQKELSINIATGSQVSMLADSYAAGNYQTRPYFDGLYLNTLTHLPAGRSLNTLIKLLTELGNCEHPWERIIEATEQIQTSELSVNLCFYDGALGNRGAIEGIREETLSVGTLFRASFASMARNYRHAASRLCPQENWQRLVLSGGLSRRVRALQQEINKQFHCAVRFPPHEEDTLMGLAVLAKVWSGQAENATVLAQKLAKVDAFD